MERLNLAFLIGCIAGVGTSTYTAYEYITQDFRVCSINQQISCAGVFASGHTSIFGIQFYVLGVVWFPVLLALGLLSSRLMRQPLNAEVLLPILMIGNIFTVYLWYLELVVIHVVCPLCVSNYVINYALTILVLVSFLREPSTTGFDPGVENETDLSKNEEAVGAHRISPARLDLPPTET